MGFIKIENITLSPPSSSPVSVAYKLASAPDVSSNYTVVTNSLLVNADASLTQGAFYIYNLLDATEYTVRIYNDCTAAQKNIISTSGANPSTTTFTPCNFNFIPNLITWIDFTDLSSLEIEDGGIRIAQDKSPSNNYFTYFETQPEATIGLNGLPGAYFNGESKMRGIQTFNNDDDYTIIHVGETAISKGSDNDGGWSMYLDNAVASVVLTNNGIAQYNANITYSNSAIKISGLTLRNEGLSSRLASFDNGQLVNEINNIQNSTLRGSSYGFLLGTSGNLGHAETGTSHEILVFNRVLTTSEMTVIHNCLRAKYNIPVTAVTSSTTTFPVCNYFGLTGASLVASNSNLNDRLGFRFTVNTDILVTKLSRIKRSGNVQQHQLYLYNSSGQILATTTVDLAFGQVDTYISAPITPITLTTGQSYAVVSEEHAGEDSWWSNSVVATNGDITVTGTAAIFGSTETTGSLAYGPTNFQYCISAPPTTTTTTTTTTSTTTTLLPPTKIIWSYLETGGNSYIVLDSGPVTGIEDIREDHPTTDSGIFYIDANHRVRSLISNVPGGTPPNQYYIRIYNEATFATVYELTSSSPIDYTTAIGALVPGQTYVIILTSNIVATTTSTTTTLAPPTVNWTFTNSGVGGTFFNIKTGPVTGEEIFQAFGSITTSGSFNPTAGHRLSASLYDDQNNLVDSDFYRIKIENVTDSVVVMDTTSTAPHGYTTNTGFLVSGKTYLVTIVTNRIAATTSTTTLPCFEVTDINPSQTYYIKFNNTDRFDSGSSNLTKYL